MNTAPDSVTHLPASDAAAASTHAAVASAAADVGSPPAPLSPAAKRARLHRKRRRHGIRPVKVLLHDIDIKALVYMGYLKPEERQHAKALGSAVYCALDMALDAAKCAVWTPPRNV